MPICDQWRSKRKLGLQVLGVDEVEPSRGVGAETSEGEASSSERRGQQTLTPFRRFVAGSLAGVSGTVVTYPLDLARARLANSKKGEFRSLWAVFRFIWQRHGPRGLYSGVLPTLQGSVVYAGCSFFTFEV